MRRLQYPRYFICMSLSTVLLRAVAWDQITVAVVISPLFVIVLWKTVVERTIHRGQSAGLDINTD